MYNIDFERLLLDLNLNKKEFANRLSVHPSSITRLIGGMIPMDEKWKLMIEKEFDLDLRNYFKDEVKQVDSNNFMEVPVITINAQAGYLSAISDNTDEGFVNDLNTMLVPKEFEKGYYCVIEINGDSMDDGTPRSICDGDKLLCQQLQKHHWTSKLHFRQYIFIIVSIEGIVCKQITAHDVESGELTLHSWNPLFKDYNINLRDVYQIFYAKKIVERRIRL